MRSLLVMVLVLIITSCEKPIFEQHYVWTNDTDTTLLLQVNPPSTGYFPTFVSNMWPPMVSTLIKPHSTYILQGSIAYDYYDIPYVLWIGNYPEQQIYTSNKTKYTNKIQ